MNKYPTPQEAYNKIGRMFGFNSNRRTKWLQVFNRYHGNEWLYEQVEDVLTSRPPAFRIGYIDSSLESTLPKVNALQACIDTLVSKISQLKVRPYVTAVKTSFGSDSVAKSLQDCLDNVFDKNHVYQKGPIAFKSAATFEYGAFWIDDLEPEIKNQIKELKPWQCMFDPVEYQAGELFTFCVRYKSYPVVKLKKKFPKMADTSDDYMLYEVFYDLSSGVRYDYVNGVCLQKTTGYDYPPIAIIWMRPPLKGGMSSTLSDDLIPLQDVLDKILWKVQDASESTPGNMIFANGSVKQSDITTENGNIFTVDPFSNGGSVPVAAVAPPFIDGEYLTWAKFLLEQMFSMTGVSQMSASAQKPSGVTSGVAIQTLDDIESDRHNIPSENMIQFYLDVALCYVYTMARAGKGPLPARMERKNVTWEAVKENIDNVTFQFSPVSVTSKNPETKIATIQQLMQTGGDIETALKYLSIQDDAGFYDIETASYDACCYLIEQWVQGNKIQIPDTLNLKSLLSQATIDWMKFFKCESKQEELDNLLDLINQTTAKMKRLQTTTAINTVTAQGQQQMLVNVAQNKAQVDSQQLINQQAQVNQQQNQQIANLQKQVPQVPQ